MAQTAAQKKKAAATAQANLKASYGFVALLAQAVPEIGRLMKTAVSQKWTSERFQMAVAGTHWWKTTPAATRQWVTQKVSDPASASQALSAGGANVQAVAGGLGFGNMSPQRSQQVWLYGQLHGYDEQAMRGLIFRNMSSGVSDADASGEFGSLMNQAREMAASYGYNPANLSAQVRAAAGSGLNFGDTGQDGLAAWQTKLKNYAKSKYVAFADRIDRGETMTDIAQPYMDTYAQVLEVNPMDVGLDDKLVQRWLQGTTEAGKPPAAVPVWQAEQDLRKDPRWGYTKNAKQQTAEVATTIGKAFGMIG